MSNGTVKTIIYILLGLIAVYFFTFVVLPYVVIGGLILYIFFTIKGYFDKKRRKTSSYSYEKTYSSNSKWEDKVEIEEIIEDDIVEVIDVDYKEVK